VRVALVVSFVALVACVDVDRETIPTKCTPVYPIACSGEVRDNTCHGSLLKALPDSCFYVEPSTQRVVWEHRSQIGAPGTLDRLDGCVVSDRDNWSCDGWAMRRSVLLVWPQEYVTWPPDYVAWATHSPVSFVQASRRDWWCHDGPRDDGDVQVCSWFGIRPRSNVPQPTPAEPTGQGDDGWNDVRKRLGMKPREAQPPTTSGEFSNQLDQLLRRYGQ
jgi:hypothetical protein